MKTQPPPPIVPVVGAGEKLHLLDMDVIEVARQMTIMDEKLWHDIRPWEYLFASVILFSH